MADAPRACRSVLMTADTVGGVFTYALELSRPLLARGHRVTLATMGAGLSPGQRDEVRRLPRLAVHESTFRLEWMPDAWDDVRRAGDWLLELERRVVPDVVHLNGYAHAALPFRAPPLVVAHSCVLSWWSAVLGEPAPAAWDRYRQEVGRGLAAARALVAPTRAMLDALVREHGRAVAGARAHVIPNGVDARPFQPAADKEPFVLGAGRVWDHAKNASALADAAASLSWPVRVAGEDVHPEGERMPLGPVEALGKLHRADLGALMARAAIFALPARYEPFGLSALEAGLSGCALVLGDIESLREVWGDAAVFVAPDDTRALRRALQALIDDPPRRRALGDAARRRALELGPRRMAGRYLALYDALASAPRTSFDAPGAPAALEARDRCA